MRSLLDARTEQWGLDITAVELRDIMLPQEMKRAMARQAEAERERRAKVIAAEGEMQAAAKLAEAAERMSLQPSALQLRMYQALTEMSSEPASKIVIPVPVELLAGVQGTGGMSHAQITQLVKTAVETSTSDRPGVEASRTPTVQAIGAPSSPVAKPPAIESSRKTENS